MARKIQVIAVGSQTYNALVILANHGPMDAGSFGTELWRGRKRGRVISSNGGGDYAAQCFLGRLRKLGLAQTTYESEGSSRWEITSKGRTELTRSVRDDASPSGCAVKRSAP